MDYDAYRHMYIVNIVYFIIHSSVANYIIYRNSTRAYCLT